MLHDFFFVGLGLIKILRVFQLVSVHDLFQIICLINDNSQFVVDTQYTLNPVAHWLEVM